MAYEQDTATDHIDLLARLRTFVESTIPLAQRYNVQRGVVGSEVIWKAPGNSSTDEIFTGIKIYSDVSADYFNFKVNGFTGYVSGNTFETQPGGCTNGPGGSRIDLGVPLYNHSLPYIFVANAQRLIVAINVNGQWESFYQGFMLPYATPNQWPYPLVVGAMLPSASATRYSDTTQSAWFKGNRVNLAMRFVDGNWRNPQILSQLGTHTLRNTAASSGTSEGYYGLHPLILSENVPGYVNDYGELDGVYFISGYQNTVGNTLTVDGIDYFVLSDVYRDGFKDYVAVRLN